MSNKLVIIAPGRDSSNWVKALKQRNKDLEIEIFPDDTKRAETEFILTWNPPEDVFKKYPNVKVIASMGAGVKHIFKQNSIPKNVAVTKVEDEQLEKDLSVFVLGKCLDHLRDFPLYWKQQNNKNWETKKYGRPEEKCVGMLGFGKIGQAVGEKLYQNDFKVIGYATSAKNHPTIKTYVGKEELPKFINQCDVLVCLLPLTAETQAFLSAKVFQQLKENAYLINVGRGGHLVEEDLLEALENKQLSGAALDVFQEEPLPENHPFWKHSKISITPHIASVTHPSRVSKQILENLERLHNKEEILHQINKEKGY